jgi:hypothetical protein
MGNAQIMESLPHLVTGASVHRPSGARWKGRSESPFLLNVTVSSLICVCDIFTDALNYDNITDEQHKTLGVSKMFMGKSE